MTSLKITYYKIPTPYMGERRRFHCCINFTSEWANPQNRTRKKAFHSLKAKKTGTLKRQKRREMESEEEDERTESQKNDTTDLISSLPDCLLTHILSLLPTRDSVRTSILSSRWSPLWKLVPVLHLERLRNQDIVSNIWIHRNAAIPLRKFHLHMLQELDLDIYSDPLPNPPLKLHQIGR